jgi:L-asparaginase II
MRSSAKPFQTIAALELSGDAFAWSDEELAVITASHSAELRHKNIVRSVLSKANLSESELLCGPHLPLGDAPRAEMIHRGETPSKLDNNCSGKHAGMLAVCQKMHWDRTTYLNPHHPLQSKIEAVVRQFSGHDGKIPTGVDGCGVPTFFLSIQQIATAFARLVSKTNAMESAHRTVHAMTRFPALVAGVDRLDTTLMELGQGTILAKCGAEGVQCVAFTELGIGVCVKIADGSARCHPVVIAEVGRRFLPKLDWDRWLESANPPIRNTLENVVGTIRATTVPSQPHGD